ncbi:MAG TPA: chloride channel protein [Candidatus Acidoferrales bacterium]|nr:chloride channel protein [Candidatus Acidoferrales bacterium]
MSNGPQRLWRKLPEIFQRRRFSEQQVFLVLTVLIGLVAGLAAVLFTLAIHSLQTHLFGVYPSVPRYILVPTLVSLVAGFLLARYFSDARGSGVPQTEAAFHLNDGFIPLKTAWGKFITGVLCVGSGHSMGREGPSVQIGASLASSIGRWIGLSPASVKNLVPVGAAAALSAAFNTPIAAVLFALEEIVGDMNAAILGSTVVASVAAVVLERAILGNEPVFQVPKYTLLHPAELLAYAFLGVIGGYASVGFCKGLLWLRQFFLNLPQRTRVFQPAMGGLVIGGILVFMPQVMGVGYEYVDAALNGNLALKTLLLFCLVKAVATIISYSSGNAGGIFAPSLFIGAMLGGAVGTAMQMMHQSQWLLFATGDPGAYALVGMGTLFAGIIRAPMTSVFMIFELTQDYEIIVPLMIANMISYAISRRHQRVPVYHALLHQDGIHLPLAETRVAVGRWRVGDMMRREVKALPINLTAAEAWEQIKDDPDFCVPVLEDESLAGLLERQTLEKALAEGRAQTLLGELPLWRDSAHVHADQPLELALARLGETPGLLPVVGRSNARRLEGVVGLEDVLRVLQYSRRV